MNVEITKKDGLSLYYSAYCPFCIRVISFMKKNNIEVELRDTSANEEYYKDLMAARGRGTIPVLRIDKSDNDVQWLPESLDIIDYFESRGE